MRDARNEIREWRRVIDEYASLCGAVVKDIAIEDGVTVVPEQPDGPTN